MVYQWIILIVIYIALTHLIAEYIGKKRKIGYGRTVLWSIIFSPVIGLIIALSSPRIKEK